MALNFPPLCRITCLCRHLFREWERGNDGHTLAWIGLFVSVLVDQVALVRSLALAEHAASVLIQFVGSGTILPKS